MIKITHKGETLGISAWAKRLSISRGAIRQRLAKGYPVWAILSEKTNPMREPGRLSPNTKIFIEHDGQRLSLSQWSKKLRISISTLHQRYANGYPPHQILSHESFVKRAQR